MIACLTYSLPARILGPMAPPLDTLSARLSHALTLRDVPAYRASLDAGLSRAAVQWIVDHPEASGGAKLSTVRALALVLAVDPAWLAWGEPYPAPEG